MFKNIFKYYFKENIRVKEIMFWNLAFPILLSTIIFLALGNLQKTDAFEPVKIAVESSSVQEILNSIETNPDSGKKLFDIREVKRPEDAIIRGDISGYLEGKEKLTAVLGSNKMDNIVIYTAANTLNNKISLIEKMMEYEENLKRAEDIFLDLSKESKSVENNQDLSGKKTLNGFFFTILAMVALGAAPSGIAAVNMISLRGGVDVAKRFNIQPFSKFKVLLAMLLASLCIALLQSSVVLVYMSLVLGADFGNMYGLLFLAITFSSFFGLMLGALIALTIPAKMETQIALGVAIYLTSSFMAGMMSPAVRSLIANYLPLLGRINPATMIFNLFNAMYYFESSTLFFKYFKDLLIGITVLTLLVMILARRNEHERA